MRFLCQVKWTFVKVIVFEGLDLDVSSSKTPGFDWL